MTDKTFPLSAARLRQLAERFPTPFYVYDEAAMRANARQIQKAFADSQLPEMMQKFQERAESLRARTRPSRPSSSVMARAVTAGPALRSRGPSWPRRASRRMPSRIRAAPMCRAPPVAPWQSWQRSSGSVWPQRWAAWMRRTWAAGSSS